MDARILLVMPSAWLSAVVGSCGLCNVVKVCLFLIHGCCQIVLAVPSAVPSPRVWKGCLCAMQVMLLQGTETYAHALL